MTLSASQPNIDWSARAFDDDDLVISQRFRSGSLECGDILAHPKYKKEGILGALVLPHSLIHFGMGWFRSIPVGYLGQAPSTEVESESLSPNMVDDFSLKLLSSIFIASEEVPKYTASGGLSELFKSNMFKDAASISSISTKFSMAMHDSMPDGVSNTNVEPDIKHASSSLSPLSHVSPPASPQKIDSPISPKLEDTSENKIMTGSSPAVSPKSIPTEIERVKRESSPEQKRSSPQPSDGSPRKVPRLSPTSPVATSPVHKEPIDNGYASPSVSLKEEVSDSKADDLSEKIKTPTEISTDLEESVPSKKSPKSPEIISVANGASEVPLSPSNKPVSPHNLELENVFPIKSNSPPDIKPESPSNKLDSPHNQEASELSPKEPSSPLRNPEVEKSPLKQSNSPHNPEIKTLSPNSPRQPEVGKLSPKQPTSPHHSEVEKLSPKPVLEQESKSKSPTPKCLSPVAISNNSKASNSPGPLSDNSLSHNSEDSRESWQNIEVVGYPAQNSLSLSEELQDSYWTKFYTPTEAFPMKMFSKYTIHFFTSARADAGPLPKEIDLEGPPGKVADRMVSLVRRIYDQAGSGMSHELKATVNQALCVIGKYLQGKSSAVIDDFITRNYQPVSKKVSSADRIAAVSRFVSRVWDPRAPISRMSNLHVNFYKLAGLLGEQGTNSIVSALHHLQDKYPPLCD